MRKSSRLWWLHGAILVSAVIGCKNCGSSGSCGGPGGAPVGGTGSGGPIMSASPGMYSQSGATPSFSGASPMPGGTSSFPAAGGAGYPGMPNTASGIGGR